VLESKGGFGASKDARSLSLARDTVIEGLGYGSSYKAEHSWNECLVGVDKRKNRKIYEIPWKEGHGKGKLKNDERKKNS